MDYILKQIKTDLMPKQSKMGGYLYLDRIKVLAAFLVVFYYYSFYALDYGFVNGTPYYPMLSCFVRGRTCCPSGHKAAIDMRC